MLILIVLLTLSSLVWIAMLLDAATGLRRLDAIETEQPLNHGPLLSVIVAAKNEEQNIDESIRSQLVQSYPNIEWILVNDRSTDQTGKIIDTLQQQDERIKVIHIKTLPDGWLGKNHALYKGAQIASGDVLLFTDADVLFQKEALAKALHYFIRHKLDHLTVPPSLQANSFWLQSFISFFLFGFSYFKRPWLANQPHSKTGMGIGAFNMISKQAYEQLGTHERIKMRPDDDLQLGMQVKRDGMKQRIATGMELIKVEWYSSLHEAFVGLEKNTFAGLHYRISMVIFAMFGTFVSQVLPFITLFWPDRTIFLLSTANILLLAILYTLIIKRMSQFSPWLFCVFPITALLFIYSICRASFLTFKRGGIVWRGTTYSLSELRRKNHS